MPTIQCRIAIINQLFQLRAHLLLHVALEDLQQRPVEAAHPIVETIICGRHRCLGRHFIAPHRPLPCAHLLDARNQDDTFAGLPVA